MPVLGFNNCRVTFTRVLTNAFGALRIALNNNGSNYLLYLLSLWCGFSLFFKFRIKLFNKNIIGIF